MFGWIARGWRATGPQRGFLTLSALVFVVGIVGVGKLPWVGGFLGIVLFPVLALGWLLCARDVARGVKATVAASLRPLLDPAVLKRIAPFLVATYAVNGIDSLVADLPGGGLLKAVTFIFAIGISLAPYLLLFTEVPAKEAFRKSLRSMAINFPRFFVLVLASVVFVLVLAVPVFFLVALEKNLPWIPAVFAGELLAGVYGALVFALALPPMYVSGYFWFEGAFTGLDREA